MAQSMDGAACCEWCNVRPPWCGIDLKYAIGLTHGAQLDALTIPTYGKEYDSGQRGSSGGAT